jgi:peptidoglycan/LPS O-acetylase OafA/YrhL
MNKLNTSGEKVLNPYRLLGTYRALLALLVLLSHSNMWLPEWVRPLALGNVGVFLFFILSGFVIAEALDIFYPGKPQRFLLNRFLPIYPTYWSACVVAIVIYI